MSRLFVKNIPKYATEERIREHFAQKGTVTDVKIIRKPNGESRQFCYVGFSSDKDAKAAKHFFNQTFFDTRKLEIQIAKLATDGTLDKPWSKYSKGSSAYEKIQKEKEMKKKRKNDDTFNEKSKKQRVDDDDSPNNKTVIDYDKEYFMQLAKPRAQQRIWGDDNLSVAEKITKIKDKKNVKTDDGTLTVVSSLVPSKKTGGQGVLLSKTHIKFHDDDENNEEDELYEDLDATIQEGDEEESEKKMDIAHNEEISDLDYLRSKMKTNNVNNEQKDENEEVEEDEEVEDEEQEENEEDDDEKEENENDNEDNENEDENDDNDEIKEEEIEEKENIDEENDNDNENEETNVNDKENKKNLFDEDNLEETGRLFIKNISYTTTEDDLSQLFSKYGEVSEVYIPIDKESKKTKGIAYITYMIPSDSVEALNSLDNTIFQGRILHITPSKPPPAKEASTTNSTSSSSYKTKKDLEQQLFKEDDFNWNTLFLRSDTVADATSAQMDMRKGDFLSASADNLAVRLALAETNTILETKNYLLEQGVDLSVLRNQGNKKVKRSNNVMIAKNLPFSTTESEIRKLFGKFGSIRRVILPPSRAICIIEFVDTNSAKAAFKSLAYTRFKHVPLYLEWTPIALLTDKHPPIENKSDNDDDDNGNDSFEKSNDQSSDVKNKIAKFMNTLDGENEDSNTSTLFVKNLNFRTTEEHLFDHFASVVGNSSIRSVKIARKSTSPNTNSSSSLGYGFVEFANRTIATKAIKSLQEKDLDGHSLQLSFSQEKKVKDTSKRRKSNALPDDALTNKILVKNLAFEATKRDLRHLFSAIGEVKSIRLPKKFDGKSRGYAFVEMLTKQEAKKAIEALAHTHLYGRHLVIEYAKDAQKSVDELRHDAQKQLTKN